MHRACGQRSRHAHNRAHANVSKSIGRTRKRSARDAKKLSKSGAAGLHICQGAMWRPAARERRLAALRDGRVRPCLPGQPWRRPPRSGRRRRTRSAR
eukprot:6196785-Pleurochrysis_carterae.AAC.1